MAKGGDDDGTEKGKPRSDSLIASTRATSLGRERIGREVLTVAGATITLAGAVIVISGVVKRVCYRRARFSEINPPRYRSVRKRGTCGRRRRLVDFTRYTCA